MNRKTFIGASSIVGASLLANVGKAVSSSRPLPVSSALTLPRLSELRRLATCIPGEHAVGLNVTKVADTVRPANVVVKGHEAQQMMTLARTVYQLEYADGTVMIDSGMDLETHRTFGKTEEPFYPENFETVQEALLQAKLILFTHYHADHTAGVIRSPHFDKIAHKVWLTRDTADLLLHHPHKETVHIAEDRLNRFVVTDFSNCLPLAPGLVIWKTPGHTTDSKMLYIRLQDGQEFIHSVDSGWSMQNILEMKMKNASWVKENETQLLEQYRWLNEIMSENPKLTVLCTHDNEQYDRLRAEGILGSTLHTAASRTKR